MILNKLKITYHKWILTNLLRDKADIENYLKADTNNLIDEWASLEAEWELKCINNSIREINVKIDKYKGMVK